MITLIIFTIGQKNKLTLVVSSPKINLYYKSKDRERERKKERKRKKNELLKQKNNLIF